MKKMLLLSIIVFAFSKVFAASLPLIPEECFDDENYCYSYEITDGSEINDRVIKVEFVAQLFAEDFEDEQEILERFLDFDSWGDYTTWLADYDGDVKDALVDLPVTIDYCENAGTEIYNDQEVIVNNASYWTEAPWPLNKLHVVERALYFPIETTPGALFTWKFIADPDFSNGKGIKYKTGVLNISYDEDEEVYYAYVTLEVIPEIEYLPSVAAPYVTKGLVTVFSGMFE